MNSLKRATTIPEFEALSQQFSFYNVHFFSTSTSFHEAHGPYEPA